MRSLVLSLAVFSATVTLGNAAWRVGVGIGDTTGAAAETGMMGYAHPDQKTAGIHMRLFSRAFIFDDGVKRGVFVSVDMGMMGQLVKENVISQLQSEFGSLYDYDNVVLSGTHTHSGPGGFLQYVLFGVTTQGFSYETFDALVVGITESIREAHNNMQDARLFYNSGTLSDANINRSPSSYLANPAAERSKYSSDTDHLFAQLNIYTPDLSTPLGLINWFAVHPVSMNNQNKLISGDNKGTASFLLEREFNSGAAGQGPFVAAFGSSNLGDVSPNLNGPKCIDTGLPCDFETSTCDGRNEMCQADGPGADIFESTRIIGERQANMAQSLLTPNSQELSASVDFIYQWIDMTDYPVELEDGSSTRTCKAALGYSFAAGCTDGPGAFDFTQGDTTGNLFWNTVVGFLKPPSDEQVTCHAPKPVLLDTGEAFQPYQWHPDIVDTQVMKIGELIIAAMPGEISTMAGRRLREQLYDVAVANGAPADTKVTIAGLSNAYTHYITTFEEYQKQRYEAASTIYGPNTLRAYQQQYSMLTESLLGGNSVDMGPHPPSLMGSQFSFIPPVDDAAPDGTNFGDVLVQPEADVRTGDTVSATFVSGNPRNDQMLESSYLYIEFEAAPGIWQRVFTDADIETRFYWRRIGESDQESEAEIQWEVPFDQAQGTYRIVYQGYHNANGQPEFYSGESNPFQVS